MADKDKTATEVAEVPPEEDEELSELLANAVEDFDKVAKAEESKAKVDDNAKEATVKPTPPDSLWTDAFLRNSSGLTDQLSSMFSPGPDGTFSMEQLGAEINRLAEASTQNAGFETSPDVEFNNIIADALKNLSEGAENIQNPFSDEDFANLMRSVSGTPDGEVGDLLPFMENMMQKLLSKDVLKPALSQLAEKYTPWLEENRATLPAEELARFEKQLSLLQQVCTELDAEVDEDSDLVKKTRFEKILVLMHAMQDCGLPPEEITAETGPIPDEQGLPPCVIQ